MSSSQKRLLSPTHLNWVHPTALPELKTLHHIIWLPSQHLSQSAIIFFIYSFVFYTFPWAVHNLHRAETWYVLIPALSPAPRTVARTCKVLNKYLWDECIHDSKQELANYGLWAKSGPLPVCVNKVLLECSLIIYIPSMAILVQQWQTLNTWDRDHV